MLKKIAGAALLLSSIFIGSASTYYISPIGNDANSGSLSAPWATYVKAASTVAAGDTVLIQPGVYPHNANTNYAPDIGGVLRLATPGSLSAPITFRALGPVTNQFTCWLYAPYYCFDGLTWDGYSALNVCRGSGYVIMTNCTVQNTINGAAFYQDNPGLTTPDPSNAPGYCTVINCRFDHMTNSGTITLNGVSNLVQGCVFANGVAQDSIYPFGSNSVIRLNVFTNMSDGTGFGNHPDILQVFGQTGYWSVGIVFEQNYVVNCPIQLMQYETIEYTGQPFTFGSPAYVTNSSLWGIVLRNNVFEDSTMQCSIDVPNVKFYNNTFRRCSNGGALLDFTFYDPNWPGFRGAAWGGAVINNAFIDCSGSYSCAASGPSQGNFTNSAGTPVGHASILMGSGVVTIWGAYSNLVGSITSATLYCSAGDLYTFAATNFVGGTFNTSVPLTDPANGISGNTQWGAYNAGTMMLRLNTTQFPSGGAKAALPLYTVDMSSVFAASDYNYKGLPSELHGVQSGSVNLTGTNGYPAVLAAQMTNSVLTDAGANLSAMGVVTDFLGAARPQGAGFDIGAFEFVGGTTVVRPPAPTGLHIAVLGQ